MPTTGSGQFPYPNSSAVPDVPADILLLAQRNDLMSSGWTLTADATTRAALVTNGDAYEGLHVYQIDTKQVYIYQSLAWVAQSSDTAVVPTSVSGTGVSLNTTTGLVTFNGTYSAASPAIINGAFSSTYADYEIRVKMTTPGSGDTNMRLRASGTDSSNTAHYGQQRLTGSGSSASSNNLSSNGFWTIDAAGFGSTIYGDSTIILEQPFVAAVTAGETRFGSVVSVSSFTTGRGTLYHTQTVAYDGFSLFKGSGAMTGTLSIKGLR